MKLSKLFQNKERKRALKILSEAQTEILKLKKNQEKWKTHEVEYWAYEREINEQKIIEKTCLKIIGGKS